MTPHFETDGIYPFSTEPAEGFSGDPASRSGEAILTHVPTRKFVRVFALGYNLVEKREEATRFADHSEASLKAGELLEEARQKVAA